MNYLLVLILLGPPTDICVPMRYFSSQFQCQLYVSEMPRLVISRLVCISAEATS